MPDEFNADAAVGEYLATAKPLELAPRLKDSMGQAIEAKPDYEAELRRAATRIGVPVESARSNAQTVLPQSKVLAMGLDGLIETSPGTAGFLATPENAKIAHDDIDVLKGIEGTLKYLGDIGKASALQIGASSLGLVQFGAEMQNQAATDRGELLPAEMLIKQNAIANMRKGLQGQADAATPKSDNVLQSGFTSGLMSLAQNLPTLAAAVVTRNPEIALAGAGASTFGQSFGQARDKGKETGEAGRFAGVQGAIEVLTEMLPMGQLIGDIEKGTGFGKTLAKQFALDAPGEQVATLLQDFNEWRTLQPEKSTADFLKERGNAAIQTLIASAVNTGAMTSTAKVIDLATRSRVDTVRAADAAKSTEAIKTVLDGAAGSKLRERDPQTFETYMAEVTKDTPVEDLYINPQALVDALAQGDVNAAGAVLQNLPSVQAQIEEALQTGTDLKIPVAEFATYAAGTPLANDLIPHLKTSPLAQSQAEAEAFMQEHGAELAADVERVMSEQEVLEAEQVETDTVKQHFAEQLSATGRHTPDVNDAYATLTAEFYRVQAAALGITPTEMLARYPMTVQAEGVGAQSLSQVEPLFAPVPDENGMVTLSHWSERGRMKALDPEKWGENWDVLPDDEKVRVGDAPGRVYWGVGRGEPGQYTPEAGIGDHRYESQVPADRLYDLDKDTAKLRKAARDEIKAENPGDKLSELEPEITSRFEQKIKDAGYLGYWSNNPELGVVAATFEKVKSTYKGRYTEGVLAQGQGPLQGLPARIRVDGELVTFGPFQPARDAAAAYMAEAGLPYNPPRTYAQVDEARAKRIAQAYDEMLHEPSDPEVVEAYAAMIEETLAQWQAIKATGLQVEFNENGVDPYGNPRNAILDVVNNNHLWVFPTAEGFGSSELDVSDNPLLAPVPGETFNGKPVVVNDIFRVVHDYFGHIKEGVGFRADGEENAWRSHSAMYSPLARRAMTTETRGQNSWVNFGPNAEANKTASGADTVYADQKIGLLPEWVTTEGAGDSPATLAQSAISARAAVQGKKLADTIPGIKGVLPFLTEDERARLKKVSAENLLRKLKAMPSAEEMASAAYAGRAKRGWYEGSAEAILNVFGAADGTRFAALLAALSPQTSVESNAYNALATWVNWDRAGRPTDRQGILDVLGDSVQGGKGRGSILDAWINNSVRALSAENPADIELSGPKVSSFAANLIGVVDEVTNDAWMANYADIGQELFAGAKLPADAEGYKSGKSTGYVAMSVVVRKAAAILSKRTGETWTPAEVQETVWSFAKTLYEKGDSAGQDKTMAQLLEAGDLTHEDIGGTPDFAVLFASGVYRKILAAGGYANAVDALERGGPADGPSGNAASAEGAGIADATFDRHLKAVAKRLERRRAESRGTARDLAQEGLEQGQRGSFDPQSSVMTLLRGADLSTFLHESGHFYLEVLADIASQPDAPERIANDFETLLKYMGHEGKTAAEWRALPLDERRDGHETFARSFEAYLLEGKTPNNEMRGVFQRFRAWLLNIYKSIKALNVELTDDVRGVFDRMLASQQQIELAERGYSMLPLFTNAQEAGMTEEEWLGYQALGMQATVDAEENLERRSIRDMRWMANAKDRAIRELQATARAKRKAIKAEVTAEVMAEPVNRAREFLKRGLLDGQEVEGPTKLSLPELRDMYPDAKATRDSLNNYSVDTYHAQVDELKATPAEDFLHDVLTIATRIGIYLPEESIAAAKWAAAKGRFDIVATLWNQAKTQKDEATAKALADIHAASNSGSRGGIDYKALGFGKYGMAAEDGINPEQVAEMFGYSSGDELVKALINDEPARDKIDGITDQRMLERFGELTDQQSIERAAEQAIHNDARLRFVATEANALAKAAGGRRVLAEAARDFAGQMIARQRVRDISPARYSRAEVRSAKAAAKLAAEGKTAEAAVEKRNQLINGYAVKAAHAAQDEIDKALRLFAKFDSAGTRKGLDPDYRDQIDALLERFDLRRSTTLKDIDRRKSLVAWVEGQRDRGFEPIIPDGLLNEAYRKSYKEMTVEELRGLVDSVRNIAHLGRLKNKLLTAKDKRDFAQIVDAATSTIEANATRPARDAVESNTWMDKAESGVRTFFAEHVKFATLVQQMDGFKDGGLLWNVLVRNGNEAGDRKAAMNESSTKALHEIFLPLMKAGHLRDKLFIPEIGNSLSLEGRLMIALNQGNETNRLRIMDGDKWTPEQVDAILATLTEEQLHFVQKVWDHIDSYWPEIAAKQRRVTGVTPEKVEAVPVVITAANGAQVSLRGGYFPIKYDTNRSSRSEADELAETLRMAMQGAYTAATTRRGHTKARVETVERPVRKDFGVIFEHINQVTHDLAFHEYLIDANRLLRAGGIDNAIRGYYGPEAVRELRKALEDVAVGDLAAQTQTERYIGYLRTGVTVSALGYNFATALLQPLGLTQSMVRIGPRWVAKGMTRWLRDATSMENGVKWVAEKSTFMRLRASTMQREINEIRNKVTAGGTGPLTAVQETAFIAIAKMQLVADLPTWLGQYEKSMAGGVDEDTAISLADQAVRDSQGGGQTLDLAKVQRGGAWMKLFTNFYSFMNVNYNLMHRTIEQTRRVGPSRLPLLAVDVLLLAVVPTVLQTALKHAMKSDGDDWDEFAEEAGKDLLGYWLGLMVGLRDVGGIISSDGRNTAPAGLRFYKDFSALYTQAMQGEADDAFWKAAGNTAGTIFHLPIPAIQRTVSGLIALAQGETKNPGAAIVGPPPER